MDSEKIAASPAPSCCSRIRPRLIMDHLQAFHLTAAEYEHLQYRSMTELERSRKLVNIMLPSKEAIICKALSSSSRFRGTATHYYRNSENTSHKSSPLLKTQIQWWYVQTIFQMPLWNEYLSPNGKHKCKTFRTGTTCFNQQIKDLDILRLLLHFHWGNPLTIKDKRASPSTE